MKSRYAICWNEWIEDERIKTELRLLLKISSLSANGGTCFASNSYFAEYFTSSEVTISRQINKLKKLGYLNIQYERRGAEITKRLIKVTEVDYQNCKSVVKNDNRTVVKNDNSSVIENDKDNNTNINNTNINNIKKYIKKDFSFSLKTLKDLENLNEAYIQELSQYAAKKDNAKEFEAFKDYHGAKGSKFKNWSLAYNTWIRNALKYSNSNKQQKSNNQSHLDRLNNLPTEFGDMTTF